VIVTVTLNPALHVLYDADLVRPGRANRVSRVRYRTGGRGLAVARVLHTFGHEVVAAGLAGGSAGELIRNELARAGVATQFTRISAESRRVVQVADAAAGVTTSFAEPAPYITTEELGRLASDYRGLLDGATAVVLCGSLPDGMPAEIYGSFASYAADAGVPVVLDADGSALAHGAARQPALVVRELTAGAAAGGVAGPAGLAADEAGLRAPGASSVALLTRNGVRVVTADGEWQASAASGPARAGAGRHGAGQDGAGEEGPVPEAFADALVAGLVPGVALAWSWPDILRHAVALAAGWSPDGELDVDAYEETLMGVEIERLASDHAK
jgi:tagatose 6-phosphate kinase